jgi:hypothetical protein
MPTTPDFLTAKTPYGNLAAAVIFQLFFVGLVNLILNNSSDNVF